jgi:ABC-type transport system substrate-binding protein
MVKPFDDPKVRQAINYAINKEALAKVAFAGYAVPRPAWCRRAWTTPRSWARGRTTRPRRASC